MVFHYAMPLTRVLQIIRDGHGFYGCLIGDRVFNSHLGKISQHFDRHTRWSLEKELLWKKGSESPREIARKNTPHKTPPSVQKNSKQSRQCLKRVEKVYDIFWWFHCQFAVDQSVAIVKNSRFCTCELPMLWVNTFCQKSKRQSKTCAKTVRRTWTFTAISLQNGLIGKIPNVGAT